MHIGLMMECDYREGKSPEEAFDEAFSVAKWAEELDFDGVWLAERHFAPPAGAEGIPSVMASPLIFASAIASRTERIRIGTAVLVLPLGHPVRMAEEVATVDHISGGRFDLGVGRSSFPGSYQGYDVPYGESRDRFQEYLQVMRRAWTQDRFSYEGKCYTFEDVCLVPKPFQKPHPPLRVAVTTRDSFPVMGELGLPVFVGLRSMVVDELVGCVQTYREAWRKAGHAGEGDVVLRMPVHVAESNEIAVGQAEASTFHSIARIRRAYIKSVDKVGEGEAERSDQTGAYRPGRGPGERHIRGHVAGLLGLRVARGRDGEAGPSAQRARPFGADSGAQPGRTYPHRPVAGAGGRWPNGSQTARQGRRDRRDRP